MQLSLVANGYAAAALLFATAPLNYVDYRDALAAGTELFKQGFVQRSVESFDRAEELKPSLARYFWQRGISQYYDKQYVECYNQFSTDAEVSKADAEELLWGFLCRAGTGGDIARAQRALQSTKVAVDPRGVMVNAQRLYRGEISSDDMLNLYASQRGDRDFFYSRLYVSLFEAAGGYTTAAEEHVKDALASAYAGSGSGRDYMVDVATIQLKALQNSLNK